MNNICIYYIATYTYKKYFNTFYNSINENFFPGVDKHIIYINDDKDFDVTIYNKDHMSLEHVYIPHMPWPIVTLMKHWWIITNKREGYDAYFYFNANEVILPMSDICKESIIDAIDNNKFISTYHASLHYNNNNLLRLLTIANNSITIQASFFGGTYEQFYDISERSYDYVKNGLLENKIPTWHDETAYNIVIWNDFISENICIHLYQSIYKTNNPYQFMFFDDGRYKVKKNK